MDKLKNTAVICSTGLALLLASSTSYALDRQVEVALIKVCKSAISDKPIKMKNAMDDYNLKTRTVALNVVCNGQDIISFAERYGADKTASHLQNSIGNVKITDVAMNQKIHVNFE